MMAALYEGQQVGSAVDARVRPGQSRTAAAERVFGRRKPYPEGALAGPIAPIRSRTIHTRRDRKARGGAGLGKARGRSWPHQA